MIRGQPCRHWPQGPLTHTGECYQCARELEADRAQAEEEMRISVGEDGVITYSQKVIVFSTGQAF